MKGNLYYQVVQGIPNPAEDNHSWSVVEEFAELAEARQYVDDRIAEGLGKARLERVTQQERDSYTGWPLAIMKVRTEILDRFPAQSVDA